MKKWKEEIRGRRAFLAAAAAAVCVGAVFGVRMMRQRQLEETTGYEVVRQGQGARKKDKTRSQRMIVAADTIDGCLNPALASAEADRMACELVFEPLAEVQPDGSLDFVLAEAADWDGETRTLTIRLKPDQVFSDGSPVTAADVCASISLYCQASYHEDMDSPYFNIRGVWDWNEGSAAGISGLRAADERTVVVAFLETDSRCWKILETPVQKNDFARVNEEMTVPGNIADYSFEAIGTGAYRASGISRGINITLEANSNYREDIQDIRWVEFAKINFYDLEQALANEEIDVVQYTANSAQFDRLYHAAPFTVYRRPVNQIYAIGFNMNNIFLKDSRIRKVIAAAFDKKKVLGAEWSERIAPTDTIGYGTEALTDSWDANAPVHDKGEARRMMEETGLAGRISLRFPVLETNEFQKQAATQLANDLADVGITVEVKPLDSDAYVRALYVEDNFDLYIYNDIMDYDYDTFYRMTQARDGMTVAFRDNDYVELVNRLKEAADPEEYRNVLEETAAMFYDRMPVLPFGRVQKFLSISADLEGYGGKPDSLLLEQVHQIRSRSR